MTLAPDFIPFANRHKVRTCTNCVMDTTDSSITFDEKGVCDHCRTFYSNTLPKWNDGLGDTTRLERMVDNIKYAGRGREFDCILGMSGGVDSSYLVYLAKEKLGLRPLVFHVDAGWNSQIAVNNIERLVEGLKLDLYTEVIDWEEMRDLQLAYFKSGVPHIDQPQDLSFFGTMYKFAHKHRVKHILTGANLSTECIRNPVEWIYYGDSVQLRDIHGKFGTRPLVNFPVTNIIWHKIYLPYVEGIQVERPLNLMPYVKADAVKLLVDRFGWMPYPQKHFESRFTRFYEGYWLPMRFGFDTRKVQLSSLIVTLQISRAEAVEILKKPSFNEDTIQEDFNYVASKLDVSVEELSSYFYLPFKTYRDYRSQEYIFEIGARIMKLLGLEVGGKR
jgi:N-acetyl sugar amidotransferase